MPSRSACAPARTALIERLLRVLHALDCRGLTPTVARAPPPPRTFAPPHRYASVVGVSAEREFALAAAQFAAGQSACSAEARATEAALRTHLDRPDLADVVDAWQKDEQLKARHTAMLQIARRSEALRSAGYCEERECNSALGTGHMLEAQEDLVAMVGADEDVRREAYRALEDVVSRIQEYVDTFREELTDATESGEL